MRLFCIFLFLVTRLWACQICLPYPKESLLDQLNAAEKVVLGRENPEKSYHLSSIEVLRGDAEGFDLFLPSSIKRTLDAYPDGAVLAAYDGEWKPLWMYRPEQREVLNVLLANDWGEDKEKRARYFAQHLNSSLDELVKLAHIEVARAPYSQIRELEHSLTKEEILQFISKQRMTEWHALYILLLVQMADAPEEEMIAKRFSLLAEHHLTQQLAAWTLAFLETGGSVEQVRVLYFDDVSRDDKELKEVIGALGTYGGLAKQGEVVAAFIHLLEKRPSLLEKLLPWFIEWRAYEAAPAVSASLTSEVNIATLSQARAFLRDAEESIVEVAQEPVKGSDSLLWIVGLLVLCALILPFVRTSSRRE